MQCLIIDRKALERIKIASRQRQGSPDISNFPFIESVCVIIMPSSYIVQVSEDGSGYVYDNKKPRQYITDNSNVIVDDNDEMSHGAIYIAFAAIEAVANIGSRSATTIKPKPSQRRLLTKAGIDPKTVYKLLKIPSTYYIPERQPECHKTGKKMPLHTCRGHYRTLKSGKVVFVRAHQRGNEKYGRVNKDYAI